MSSIRALSVLCLMLSFLLGGSALECGPDAGGAVCEDGYCCSKWGWCGTTSDYCGDDCISQCDGGSSGGGSGGGGGGSGSGGISDIISESMFEAMFLHRNDSACQGSFYTYDAFISAAEAFPDFGNTGDNDTRKREIAAFLGQTAHETTGGTGWAAPDGPYAWGYCFVTERDPQSSYCDPNYPCPKQYYGRGPIQLTWNYNYEQCGEALGYDLINNPDLLETDAVISFESAIWFWMTQQSPKPSCHNVTIGAWQPSAADISANRLPGYGVITNIINGGLECGHGTDSRVEDRIGFYQNFTSRLETDPGDNLDCYNQTSFASGLLVATM